MKLSPQKAKQLLQKLPESDLSPGRKRKLALFLASQIAGEKRTAQVIADNDPDRDEIADEEMRAELRDIFTRREAGQGLLNISEDEWRNLD